jgi:two-component system, OmpR family, response regulator
MTDPLHVLVVDDEMRIRTMLRRYFVEEGFKVSDAGDGADMRAVLEREAIDLVLLDLMMPGEDGLSLTRYIRQRSEIPIIMLTGKGDLIDRVAGLETGADDYITKPFELREILARIRTVMRRAGLRTYLFYPYPAQLVAKMSVRFSCSKAGGSTYFGANYGG